jgi:hypothetical protein
VSDPATPSEGSIEKPDIGETGLSKDGLILLWAEHVHTRFNRFPSLIGLFRVSARSDRKLLALHLTTLRIAEPTLSPGSRW